MQGRLTGRIFGAAAIIVMATGLSACSIVPNWMNPISWFSDDDEQPTPDLANLPAKPDAKSDKDLADSLKADRTHAQYSADALRGGTEPAAAPPPKASSSGEGVLKSVEATEKANTARQEAQEAEEAAEAAAEVPKSDRSVTSAPKGKPAIPGTLPDSSFNPPAAPAAEDKAADKPAAKDSKDKKTSDDMSRASSPVRVARADTSARSEHAKSKYAGALAADFQKPAAQVKPVQTAAAKPAVAHVKVAAAKPQVTSDGFQKSSAPPLDPSVSEFVPSSVLQHYNSTASAAQQMPAAHGARQAAAANTAMAILAQKTVVFFPNDITYVNGKGMAQVRALAQAFLKAGAPGNLRVIGHSSSRTANMPVKQHLALIYRKSKDRADAVAKALIRAGVPAKDILEEAVGDSQPVYYESMPKGEEGNRRVEIFLQR